MTNNKENIMTTNKAITDTAGRKYDACPACGYLQIWDTARCCECGA